MKSLITVTLNKPAPCGATLEQARALVGLLTDVELVELAAQLRAAYPERFVP